MLSLQPSGMCIQKRIKTIKSRVAQQGEKMQGEKIAGKNQLNISEIVELFMKEQTSKVDCILNIIGQID